jgi:hypothetical protein
MGDISVFINDKDLTPKPLQTAALLWEYVFDA